MWFKEFAVCLALFWVLYRGSWYWSQSYSKLQKKLHLFTFNKLFNFYFDFFSNQDDRNLQLSHPLSFANPKGQVPGTKLWGPLVCVSVHTGCPGNLPCPKWHGLSDAVAHSIFRDAPGGTWTPLPRQGTPTRASHTLVHAGK